MKKSNECRIENLQEYSHHQFADTYSNIQNIKNLYSIFTTNLENKLLQIIRRKPQIHLEYPLSKKQSNEYYRSKSCIYNDYNSQN